MTSAPHLTVAQNVAQCPRKSLREASHLHHHLVGVAVLVRDDVRALDTWLLNWRRIDADMFQGIRTPLRTRDTRDSHECHSLK